MLGLLTASLHSNQFTINFIYYSFMFNCFSLLPCLVWVAAWLLLLVCFRDCFKFLSFGINYNFVALILYFFNL